MSSFHVSFTVISLCVSLSGDMFVVDEGSSACLCGGVLGAEDPDTYPEELLFLLENPPLQGFLENTLPSPGFEKSNAGLRVGQWHTDP